MTKNIKASNSAIVLTDLAQEINQHEKSRRACEVKGIMHAIRMGELLIEAKKVAPHGTFRAWVEANTSVSQRMAQMYMKVAGDRRIVDMIAHEYETVSHLTLTQAVKLAQQHKAVETLVKEIKVIWKRVQADQREVANGLTEVHKSFEGNNEKFKKWMVEAVGYSKSLAETTAVLVGQEYDAEAWTDAILTDLEAGNFPKCMQGDSAP